MTFYIILRPAGLTKYGIGYTIYHSIVIMPQTRYTVYPGAADGYFILLDPVSQLPKQTRYVSRLCEPPRFK
jgi:hypothetical protein